MRKILSLALLGMSLCAQPGFAQVASKAGGATPPLSQDAVDRYISTHPGSNRDSALNADRFCKEYRRLGLSYIAQKAAKKPQGEIMRQARLETERLAPGADYTVTQATEDALLGLVRVIYERTITDRNAFGEEAYTVCMEQD